MFLRRLFGIFFLCSLLVTPIAEPARGQPEPVSPVLVKDINTCTDSAYPDLIAQTNSVMYFMAYQANIGSSLWGTDGTDAGTVRIKTFEAGITVQKGWKNLWLGDSFFFLTQDSPQVYSLWISDGTNAGTHRVKELIPAFERSYLSNLVMMNGALYFALAEPFVEEGSVELWRSDGTPEGTLPFLTFQFGHYMDFFTLAAYQGYLYFPGYDPEHGKELWRSDGTAAGTGLFLDMNSNGDGSPADLYVNDGAFYFTAMDSTWRYVLWTSNGTPEGTRPILTEGYSPVHGDYAFLNGILYFPAKKTTGGLRIWRTDGTDAGTWVLKDVPVEISGVKTWYGLGVAGNTLYFQANQTELWKSDGSEAGTVLVKNLDTSIGKYTPATFLDVGGILYFEAYYLNTLEGVLWRSDGTTVGTNMVDNGYRPLIFSGPWVINQNQVLYSGYTLCAGQELQRIDEASVVNGVARAELVKDIETKTSESEFSSPVAYRGKVYFGATDGRVADALWSSDGTAVGTQPVQITSTVRLDSKFEAVAANGLLFFTGHDEWYTQVWLTDGSDAGTIRLTEMNLTGPLYRPYGLTAYHDKAFFFGDQAGSIELWGSDGSRAGTSPVTAFGGVLKAVSYPVELNGWLYLLVLNASGQTQLYRSDGAAGGTTLVRTWDGDGTASPGSFVKAGGRLFFTAWDANHGRELWSSDGTPTGTQLYADIKPGAASSGIAGFTAVGDRILLSTWLSPDWALWTATGTGNSLTKLLSGTTWQSLVVPPLQGSGKYMFFATGQNIPDSLWRTDGTPEGTIQLNPSAKWASSSLAVVGGRAFFDAFDPEHGWELWTSDSTVEGTHLAFDLFPGPDSSNPENIYFVKGALWFSADDGVHGSEPWIYDFLTEHVYLPVAGR